MSPLDTTSARRITKLIEDAIREESDTDARRELLEVLDRVSAYAGPANDPSDATEHD